MSINQSTPPRGTKAPTCFLCKGETARILWTITGQELRAIFRETGRHLSEGAYGPVSEGSQIHLFECTACGFHYFDPTLVGSGEFYAELQEPSYYPEAKPEFEFALRFCGRHGARRLLDVGSGTGAFLDAARDAGFTVYGVELNARAAVAAASKGHRMISKMLAEISPDELGGPVDLVSFFQVIEHVPDPQAVVIEAKRLLAKGGHVIVSVPHREGLIRRLLPYDPLNMPPHHLSHWRRRDLAELAKRSGLRVVATGTDTLYGRDLEHFWVLHNRIAKKIGRQPWLGGTWLPRVLGLAYRKLGLRHLVRCNGMGIYAVMGRE